MNSTPPPTERSSALRDAKIPRTIAAGPYGHPFHPVAVTIPIGAWTASVVFDVIGLFAEDPAPWALGARVLILIGLAGAVIAAGLGLLDFTRLARGTVARRTALVHMILNVAAMVVFALSAVVRFADADAVPVLAFILSLIALGALGISGWLGGKLAYRWGVRVAEELTQAEGFRPR